MNMKVYRNINKTVAMQDVAPQLPVNIMKWITAFRA